MKSIELGARLIDRASRRWRFCVWAPAARQLELRLLEPSGDRLLPLSRRSGGYFALEVAGLAAGTRYRYRIDRGDERPDPASRSQPEGVHGPSALVDPRFAWSDSSWQGVSLERIVLYELHVGAFTEAGTFDAAIAELPRLRQLGVTAVELMPIIPFPGRRNWGYDGVHPFAVHAAYGGWRALQRFVDACHGESLAVILDVVYNHLGPEGNYLWDFARDYFTDRYRTPWGDAINFDGPRSDHVRRYFIESALQWIVEAHVDGLRLDAVHAIFDFSAQPFLGELAATTRATAAELGRPVYLFAESDLNDSRLVRGRDAGGLGLHSHWCDDFHHALHGLLTGERAGYYEDFGSLDQLASALRQGYVFTGQYSRFRQRRHGNATDGLPATSFVVFSQNHDQVGNRMRGERLAELLELEQLKLAAATTLLSPFIPLLFMGEEYAERSRFPFFVSHGDEQLIAAVRRGRREEFAAFVEHGEPPDPQAEETFRAAKLDPTVRADGPSRQLERYYQQLLALRRDHIVFDRALDERREVATYAGHQLISLLRRREAARTVLLLCFAEVAQTVELTLPRGSWRRELDSADESWGGAGTRLPTAIDAHGDNAVALTLAPWSAALLLSRT